MHAGMARQQPEGGRHDMLLFFVVCVARVINFVMRIQIIQVLVVFEIFVGRGKCVFFNQTPLDSLSKKLVVCF